MLANKLMGKTGEEKTYIEDVFSTYLYTGNGSTQTINNGIDLASKGGMVWTKSRSAVRDNNIVDTVRGGDNMLYTDQNIAQFSLTGLGFSPFTFGSSSFVESNAPVNAENNATFVSWTFRKAPKFFDVVTFTNTNSTNQRVSHSLGVAPGMIFIKSIDSAESWPVYQQTLGRSNLLALDRTDAQMPVTNYWGTSDPTATDFGINSTNLGGTTYVAYLFAHDTTADGLIQCGSFTTDGSGNATVDLGWEPQYVMVKRTNASEPWYVYDTMRGMSQTGFSMLYPHASSSEYVNTSALKWMIPTATGISVNNQYSSSTYIYMAIRRGPMRTPTDGTKVFNTNLETSSTNPQTLTTGFPVDLTIQTLRSGQYKFFVDRLRGSTTTSFRELYTPSSDAEIAGTGVGIGFDNNSGIVDNGFCNSASGLFWNFQRAPGFFDVMCYTGEGTYAAKKHSLGVSPELIITKSRSGTGNWYVQVQPANQKLFLNNQAAAAPTNVSQPTATDWYPIQDATGATYVSYLFASCPGVSKVGTFTSNNADQLIDCGFTNGARFVMIKATSTTGDWMVFDTARGIVAGNDAMIKLNTSDAESSADYVDPYSAGFGVTSALGNGITYIYLAIA